MRAHGLWTVAETPEEAVRAVSADLTIYDIGDKY